MRFFGKNYHEYHTQEEKLSYVVMYLLIMAGEPESYYDFVEYDLKPIWEYANADGIAICFNGNVIPDDEIYNTLWYEEVGFDHQTYPDSYRDCLIDFMDKETFISQIFIPCVYINTYCD